MKLSWCSRVGSAGIALSLGLAGVPALAATQNASPVLISQRTTAITAGQINTIIKQMLAASEQRSTAGIMKYIAPQATFDMTVQFAGNNQQLQLSRQEYEAYLVEGFAITQAYRSRVSQLKIQVAANKKSAIVTYVLDEATTIKPQYSNQTLDVKATSNARLRFELVNGQVLITSSKTVTRMNANL